MLAPALRRGRAVGGGRRRADYLNRAATAKSNMYDNKPDETKYIYADFDTQDPA
jgi:hypothetical protein